MSCCSYHQYMMAFLRNSCTCLDRSKPLITKVRLPLLLLLPLLAPILLHVKWRMVSLPPLFIPSRDKLTSFLDSAGTCSSSSQFVLIHHLFSFLKLQSDCYSCAPIKSTFLNFLLRGSGFFLRKADWGAHLSLSLVVN